MKITLDARLSIPETDDRDEYPRKLVTRNKTVTLRTRPEIGKGEPATVVFTSGIIITANIIVI